MKHFIVSLAALMALSLSACSQSTKKENKQMQTKTLVAYFSATGTTKALAERIAQAAGADLLEIEPAVPYTAADLDWTNAASRSTVEMKDPASRPALKNAKPDVSQYDTIYLGFPIWWYQQPTIINTFIEAANLKGKTVKTFATSGGSTVERADSLLKAAYPDVKWQAGATLNGAGDADIARFVK